MGARILALVVIVTFYISGPVIACTIGSSGSTSLEIRRSCAVELGTKWLLDNRNSEWGWGERQEAEAIIALHLANNSWFNKKDSDSYRSVKQMNIDLLVQISKDNSLNDQLWSRGKLAQYICGLQATCQDPRNFYGHDLIQKLEAHMDNYDEYFHANHFAFSWAVLALCNSNQVVKADYVSKLTKNPGTYTFGIDEASMVLMALSCINSSAVSCAKTAAENYIIHNQNKNGSFGNEYTNGLAIQALLASRRNGVGSVIDNALEALINIQAQANGGFKNVAAANQALPALARKSYVDIGKTPCVDTEATTKPPSGLPITITISVEDNLFSHFNQTWTFDITNGTSLYDALVVLQNKQVGFSFHSILSSWGHSIKTIVGISSDATKRTYWSLRKAPNTPSGTGVSSTYPKDNDHYIFRMATW